MHITIRRDASDAESTLGHLSIDGDPICFTLEDVVREVDGQPVDQWKVFGKTAIPRGTYTVTVTHSPHFGRDLPLLLDVPGFDGVRIHPGNTAADTEGCILVGETDGLDFIGQSRAAFDHLFPLIEAAVGRSELVTLTIS